LRFQYPGAIYHVMARGDGGKTVFENNKYVPVRGLTPERYLTDVLTRLPGMVAKDAVTLTPANWLKARNGKPGRMAA
jgi:hypothetical protein